MNRGVAFTEQGAHEETEPALIEQRRKEAEADYKKSIELNPTNPSAYYNLGNLKRKQSRWSEAADEFAKANEHAPENFHSMATTGLANAYSKLNRHAEAVQAYELVLSKNPKDTRAILLRGKANIGLGNTESALSDFADGIQALKETAKASEDGMRDEDKKLLATAHFERGSLYLKDSSQDAQKAVRKSFVNFVRVCPEPVVANRTVCHVVKAQKHPLLHCCRHARTSHALSKAYLSRVTLPTQESCALSAAGRPRTGRCETIANSGSRPNRTGTLN
jgi:tetratricopeptide (TPR) repeat protein